MAHIIWVTTLPRPKLKVGCAFPMVISSDFRMGKHRDGDHEEDAPYCSISIIPGQLIGHVRDHCGAVSLGTHLYLFSGSSLPGETVKKRYSFRSLNNYLNLILDLILEGNSLLLSFHS